MHMHLSLAHAAELTSKSGMESEEHFLLGCLSAPYLPTYLPTCLPTYLPAYLPTYLLAYLPTYLPSLTIQLSQAYLL